MKIEKDKDKECGRKISEKLDEGTLVLNAPKKVIDKIKSVAKKPEVQKVKQATIVASRKTRKYLRNAAKDVRDLKKTDYNYD